MTNADLAVHGIDNLFVCSNAVLPNAAAVNPTLTLAALALRLGSHLARGGSAMNDEIEFDLGERHQHNSEPLLASRLAMLSARRNSLP